MKLCPRCLKTQVEFWRNRANRDGLATYCIPCEKELKALRLSSNPAKQREYQVRYRNSHREERNAANRVFNARPSAILLRRQRHDRNVAVMLLAKARGCVDCGERDPIVLDFDHVRGNKKWNIGHMRYASLEHLQEELAKCEVRCANCHRRMTHARKQHRKSA